MSLSEICVVREEAEHSHTMALRRCYSCTANFSLVEDSLDFFTAIRGDLELQRIVMKYNTPICFTIESNEIVINGVKVGFVKITGP